MAILPIIGHTILVGIVGSIETLQQRPRTPISRCIGRLVVVLRIDESLAKPTTCMRSLTIACVIHHQRIHPVTRQGSTGILQHLLVSCLSIVCGDIDKVHRLHQLDGIFGNSRIKPVVIRRVYLIVKTIRPVVLSDIAILRVHIAIHIILSPLVKSRCIIRIRLHITVGTDTHPSNTLTFVVGGRTGTGLIVVVHDVHRHTLATVATVSTIIVDDVVSHVHTFVKLCGRSGAQSGSTAGVMGNQVVMERSSASTPVATISVRTFGVSRVDKTLGNDAPLHRRILVSQYREALVDAPADRAMVYQQILLVETTEAVPTVSTIYQHILVAQAETHESHNDIAPFDGAGIARHTDTVARSRLSRNRRIGRDTQCRLQMYRT